MKIWVLTVLTVATLATVVVGKAIIQAPTAVIPIGFETKIINGDEAPPHSHPHQVSLQFKHPRTKNWYHFCGGSILDNKTIVTAAHCVKGFESLQCRVDVGDHDLAKVEETEQVFDYKPHEQFWHPLFNVSTIDWDYAIIKLETPITFSENVQPIQLPEDDSYPEMDCWSSGWGSTRGDGTFSFPTALQEVRTPLMDWKTCYDIYMKEGHEITERVVCAGGMPMDKINGTYEGICQGDSGGPLVCKDYQGMKRLVGITSFSAFPCAKGYPGGYADVNKALQWIRLFMEN